MIANYHTHTSRCRHAVGEDREYVEKALEAGLQILGFSDHTPYWFGCDYYSTYRMYPEQLESYVNSVLDLRREFAGKIQIPLGLETEFYPKYFPELMARLRDTPVEYLLLGQHFVGNEIGQHYSGAPTADPSILHRYCNQVCDAMQTGLFSYLAHPDLMYFVGEDHIYRHYMRQICREAKQCGMPLEINLLGIARGRNYPDRRFWEIAGEEGCRVVLGIDAHEPKAMLDKKSEAAALALAQEYGLVPEETVQLHQI